MSFPNDKTVFDLIDHHFNMSAQSTPDFSQHIEEEAIGIIDHCFKTLRSSTTAFDLLLKFKHIHTREAINSHLMRKFNDILVQFCKEVKSWN